MFQSKVEALHYLPFIQPFIIHVVNWVCQYFSDPIVVHLKVIKCILRYLKGTQNLGLRYLSTNIISF